MLRLPRDARLFFLDLGPKCDTIVSSGKYPLLLFGAGGCSYSVYGRQGPPWTAGPSQGSRGENIRATLDGKG
jgi:hypothetical protein